MFTFTTNIKIFLDIDVVVSTKPELLWIESTRGIRKEILPKFFHPILRRNSCDPEDNPAHCLWHISLGTLASVEGFNTLVVKVSTDATVCV